MNASCQCGAIAFKTPLAQPLALYICHCDECRRQSSSAFGCSAIFPAFPLLKKEGMGCYSRSTASGGQLNCYFCKKCGTRLVHSTPGKEVVSVKGGCIEGLDWSTAVHIWCKRAVVPIPLGVQRVEEEPDEDFGVGAAKVSATPTTSEPHTGLGIAMGRDKSSVKDKLSGVLGGLRGGAGE